MRLLLHKGLDDGAERLRAQLRDTAQQGRRDEYGGDDIEDTAVSGSKRAAAELLKQRKEKATEQPSDPARNGASAPDAHRNESSIIRTKDTEFAETQTPAATPQAQARRAAMQKAAAVKMKDTYIETQVKTSVTEAPEPQRQGSREAPCLPPARSSARNIQPARLSSKALFEKLSETEYWSSL